MSLADQLKRRAAQGERVDADMLVETLILVGEQHLDKPRIDILDTGRQAPSALRRGVGTQQPALAIQHAVRRVDIFSRWRTDRDKPAAGGNGDDRRRTGQPASDAPASYHFALISMVPVAVRPKRSGRYMSSTLACGSTYLPGDTARTT